MPFSQCGSLIPRIGDDPLVSTAWESLVQGGTPTEAGVRSVVLDSWQRCLSEAVNPGSRSAPSAAGEQVSQLAWQNRDLCDAARPVLEGLRGILKECGSLIMLSDPQGIILMMAGETRVRSAGEAINLAVGGQWGEELIGTNAIGTAIATGGPVQIHASEHFCLDVKRWTCAAAPVRDPVSRTLLGVLDVSGVKESFHGHTLGLVMTAARQIEGEIARRDGLLQGRLLSRSLEHFGRYANDGLVLCDHRGRIIRANGPLPEVWSAHGVRHPLAVGVQLDALDLNQPETERDRLRPPWLSPQWLHPILDQDGELGTLLVIPVTPAPSASSTSAARFSTGASPPPAPAQASSQDAGQDAFADIIGHSEVLQATRQRARRMARLDLPVLLQGETGAGKELFARALHRSGLRPKGPFVAVNCGALTRELLASELFGYAEGAFTGARRSGMPGRFEQADGGTLFLDEIGELPLDMQPHLLRVLQDGVVVRLGDTRERQVSVRLITATHRDLRHEVAGGRFREDLYHRLCVLSLPLPALRDRPGDIDAIIDYLNHKLAHKYGCAPKHVQPAALQALRAYRWPGNIRELQNVFEATFVLTDDDTIELAALPPAILQADAFAGGAANGVANGAPHGPAPTPSLAASGRLEDLEQHAILDAIEKSQGNRAAAARLLGIARSTLYVKLAGIRAGSSGL
ncbi:MAG: sigma-54-dependent Fis family transcriptional regulator [Curvibacter sp.]|nr:sigma-54-dependent Fis family transcriptional regulator [Curvibacter sp.]